MLVSTVKTMTETEKGKMNHPCKNEGRCSIPQRLVADLVIWSTFLYS